jgi:hypothetical protein
VISLVHQIINKGNSLILATNRKGEVVFFENVETILGYTVDQVMVGVLEINRTLNFMVKRIHTKF